MGNHSKSRALLASALILGLTACSSSRHDPLEKYYLVSVNIKNAYWQAAGAGFIGAARGLGVAAEVVGPDTYDPPGEAQAFRDAVAKKPSGILVSVADPNLMKDPIDSAIALGIPVITIDSDAPASKRLTFIGTNNYQAGMMGGRVLAVQLHGKGNVVVYTMPASRIWRNDCKGTRPSSPITPKSRSSRWSMSRETRESPSIRPRNFSRGRPRRRLLSAS